MKIINVPRRIKAGINPLKRPRGPTLIVSLKQSNTELYFPGGAFIIRVFITSAGMVSKVAIVAIENKRILIYF